VLDDFANVRAHIQRTIVGQDKLVNRLLISLLTGGHMLLEGPPGLAKTTAVKALADSVHASFQRIQFTPDLMPADITGSDIYDAKVGEFRFLSGPLFNEIILADEINRAPPKVQSALLESMEEHQVTIGNETHALPELFLVIATQNPIEQSGTYPLPEAQLDRFQLHVVIDYPNAKDELEILNRSLLQKMPDTPSTAIETKQTKILPEQILAARKQLAAMHVEESVKQYIVDIVTSTRNLEQLLPEMSKLVLVGASPRASKALLNCAMAYAFLLGRDYVTPDDVFALAHDVLRHRLLLSFQAMSGDVGADDIIDSLLNIVPIP